MDVTEFIYIGAGIALPLYYVPQIRRCLLDDTQLSSYSITKSASQAVLRLLMLPFIVVVGNPTMTTIVALDLLGRLAELAASLVSLRRQGWSWHSIARRASTGLHGTQSGPLRSTGGDAP